MALLVEEIFDYAAAYLNGQNDGIGWNGAWSCNQSGATPYASTEIGNQAPHLDPSLPQAGPSQYYTNLNAGNGANNNEAYFLFKAVGTSTPSYGNRTFNAISNDGKTYWVAFTLAVSTAKYAITWQLTGLTTDAAGTTQATVLNLSASTTRTQVSANGTNLWLPSAVEGSDPYTAPYAIHLIVIKIAMSGVAANPVTVTWYLDPDLSKDSTAWTSATSNNTWYVKTSITNWGYPATGTATSSSDSRGYMDNFRIATTWQEAVGVQSGNFFMMF